jgi:AcrR family transcriptional regulator
MNEIIEDKFIPMLVRIKEMFLEFGIKSLNMDDISRKLGISKKTLYRFVDSKESLIGKMFELEYYKWELFFTQLNERSLNAIEKLFEVSLRLHEEMMHFNPKIVFEFKKYYESLFDEYTERNKEFIGEKMSLNLIQGISEGLYRSDVNIELAVALYINSLVEMHNNALCKNNNVSFDQLFEVLFDHHIRAISTPEGLAYYENRKNEIPSFNKKNNIS